MQVAACQAASWQVAAWKVAAWQVANPIIGLKDIRKDILFPFFGRNFQVYRPQNLCPVVFGSIESDFEVPNDEKPTSRGETKDKLKFQNSEG